MITLHSALTEDWAGNGICVLLPTECEIEEEAGGLYELTMTHTISDDLRARAIERGMLIKTPVPARETPLIQISAEGHPEQAEHEVWDTNKDTKVWSKPSTGTSYSTWSDMTEYSKGNKCTYQGKNYAWNGPTETTPTPPGGHWKRVAATSNVLKALESGEELIYHGAYNDTWSHVTTSDGVTGYIKTADIDYLRTEPYIPARPSRQEAVPARQVREQLFRIYSVEVDSSEQNVIVKARQISYDMTGNVIKSYVAADETPQDVLDGISLDLTNENDFRFYTNLTGTVKQDYARKNLIQALLDPDIGLVPMQNAMMVRDNYDVFILAAVEIDRGVRIKYGKNLLGINVTEDQSSIITRIIPVGKNKDGKPLLLPEVCIDSERIYDYPTIIAKSIDYDVQVKDATEDEPEVTTEQAYQLLRDKVAEEFAKGCDLPDIDVDVDFVHLGDTVEYDAFRELQQVFLYDTIGADYLPMGIDLAMKVTGYKFDSIRKKYTKIKLSTKIVKRQDVTAAFELPDGGIGGTKIAYGAVNSQHLRDLAVLTAHIANLAVNAAKIQDAAIETAKIKDLAVIAAKIANLAVETAKIKDLAVTDAKISNLGVSYAKIKDLLTDTAIFTQGIGDELYINRLYVTAANVAHLEVGELVYKDANGDLWKIGVDGSGNVTATKVEVEYQNLSSTALLNISEYVVEKSETAPSSPYVGKLWLKPSTGIVSRCTAVTPSVVWEAVKAGELHTSYISATEKGLEILSSGIIEVKAGGALRFKSMGSLSLEAGASVNILTDDFKIMSSSGDRELLVVDESSVRVGADILEAPSIKGNVLNTFPGGTIPWKGSPPASINSIGKHFLADGTLTIPDGTYPGFTVKNIKGGRLTIKFSSGVKFTSPVLFYYCDDINIYADNKDTAYITPNDTVSVGMLYVVGCKRFRAYRINLSGTTRTSAADGTQTGLYVMSSEATIDSCSIDKTCANAALIDENSTVYLNSCFGGIVGGNVVSSVANLGNGVRSLNGSHVEVNYSTFASVNGDSSYRAILNANGATPTGSTGTTPAAPQTKTYAVSAGYTVKTTSDGSSSVTWASGEPRQGSFWQEEIVGTIYDYVHYNGFGLLLLSGAGSIVSDRPSGKTIASARMTIRRDAGTGTSGDITCTLYRHNFSSAPTGAPLTVLSTVAASDVSIAPGEEVTIELNAGAVSALNGGTCKGFGWRNTGGYGRYDIYGELEVTYTL